MYTIFFNIFQQYTGLWYFDNIPSGEIVADGCDDAVEVWREL